ncbi:MAG: hypothetical protein KI790_13475 [Cyclobacteriaceae bacterium]|nr:hypothetical protein [Cyclobacteriaceae bacterium HetDA_MAG_MS6]
MNLKTFVKISKVSNLSDARYCAGMGVDVLGFCLDPKSTDYVSPEVFKEITEWVAGIDFAGEFANMPADQIKIGLTDYDLQFLEVNQINQAEELQYLDIPIILKWTVNATNVDQLSNELSLASDIASMVVINLDESHLSAQVQQIVQESKDNIKLIKGYEIDSQITAHLDGWQGIEMEATKEERPGYKDYGQIMDILEVLEEY